MPEDRIAVSVIVPACNEQRDLPQCLQALHRQSLNGRHALEVIVIDDGSDDRTHEIALEFCREDPGCFRLHRQSRTNPCSARNTGLALARGNYIAFCGTSIRAESEMYAALYDACEQEHSDIAVCGCYYNEKAQHETLHGLPGPAESNPDEVRQAYLLHALSGTPGAAALASSLFRADLLRQHGLFFRDPMGRGEELLFVVRSLAACSRLAMVQRPLCRLRDERPQGIDRPGLREDHLMLLAAFLALPAQTGEDSEHCRRLLCSRWIPRLREICLQDCLESRNSADFYRRMISLAGEALVVRCLSHVDWSILSGQDAACYNAFAARDWIRLEAQMQRALRALRRNKAAERFQYHARRLIKNCQNRN